MKLKFLLFDNLQKMPPIDKKIKEIVLYFEPFVAYIPENHGVFNKKEAISIKIQPEHEVLDMLFLDFDEDGIEQISKGGEVFSLSLPYRYFDVL